MSAPAEATVVLAHAPDGARHVFLTSTRRSGTRSVHHGIADPSSAAPAGSLARLVAPTRLVDDADLADLLAHLVALPAPFEDDAAPRPIDVLPLTSGPPLPSSLPGPLGRDFALRTTDPDAALDAGVHALLFASPSAPGGAWWRAIGTVPHAVLAFGHLAARAGLFGADAAGDGGALVGANAPDGDASEANAPNLDASDLDATAIEARLRGVELPAGAAPIEVRTEGAGALWTLGRGDDARAWSTAAWDAADVERIDAARGDALLPYWLLLFETRAGVLRLSRVENARRHFVARLVGAAQHEVEA